MKKKPHADLIYLVRHGVAEDDHPLGDEARALTREGRASFRRFAAELAEELALVGVVSSPLVRAVQTAEILAAACEVDDIRIDGALTSDDATAASITALDEKLGPGWALVGHNPSIAEACTAWLGRGQPAVQFRKGGVAAFHVEAGKSPAFRPAFMTSPGRKKDKLG